MEAGLRLSVGRETDENAYIKEGTPRLEVAETARVLVQESLPEAGLRGSAKGCDGHPEDRLGGAPCQG